MRFALIVSLSVCLLGATPVYRVIDLGTLGGASAATAINASGLSAGWSLVGSQSVRAMESDGAAPPRSLAPSRQSRAYGINEPGTLVGVQYDVYGRAHAAMWNGENEDGTELAGADSYALAINASGVIAGAVSGRAVRITTSGDVEDVGVNAPWSSANAINGSGGVAGSAQLFNGRFRAFSAPGDGPVTMIGTLGGSASYGQAINDEGWVAGGSTTVRGYLHAFLYAKGNMQDLGTLGGTGNSSAYGINQRGQVVGYSNTRDGQSSAFLWEGGAMRDLNHSIAADAGWRLLEASAINDRGQIVGFGLFGGAQRAFRLDPIAQRFEAVTVLMENFDIASTPIPEPNALVLVAAGLAAIAFGLSKPGYFN